MMSKPGWLDSYTEELRRDVVALFRSNGAASVPSEVIDRAMVVVLSEVIESLYRRIDVLEDLYRRQEAVETHNPTLH
jgi:hypothetical protein